MQKNTLVSLDSISLIVYDGSILKIFSNQELEDCSVEFEKIL